MKVFVVSLNPDPDYLAEYSEMGVFDSDEAAENFVREQIEKMKTSKYFSETWIAGYFVIQEFEVNNAECDCAEELRIHFEH